MDGKQDELTREALVDQAWDDLDAAEQKSEPDSDGLSADTDADPEEDATTLPDTTVTPGDSDVLTNATENTDSAEAKALKDTKAWATKLAQENAELKKLVAEGATKKEIAEQEKTVEQAKKGISDDTLSMVYREYPELKEVLSPLLDTIKEIQEETLAVKKSREESARQAELKRKQDAIDYFESTIMPKVMETHSDFKEIIADTAFFEWAEQQRPGLKTAALQSNDPEDLKWAISEYKKTLAGAEAGKLKQTEDEKRKQKLNNQMTLRGGSSQLPSGKGKDDPADYDSAWEKAEAEERRNR